MLTPQNFHAVKRRSPVPPQGVSSSLSRTVQEVISDERLGGGSEGTDEEGRGEEELMDI